MKLFISLLVLLPLFAQAAPKALNLIAITDFHGALEAEEASVGKDKTTKIGGAAVLSSYVSILRKKLEGPSLLVDGGDLFQGTMESNLFEGAPVIRFYNYLGVSAAVIGNHEFDFGPAGEKAVPRTPSDDGQGALKERIKEANFPFLAINILKDGKRPAWAKASTIVTVDGIKVGLIGAATPETPNTTNRMNLEGLTFPNPVPLVKAEAQRLRDEENVDLVVLTTHIGAGCDDNKVASQDDLSSCRIKDVLEFAAALPEGLVDAIVAGHTHRGALKRVNKTVILQSFSSGKYISWAKLPLDRSEKPEVSGMAPVCLKTYESASGPTCDPYQLKNVQGTAKPAKFLGEAVKADAEVTKLLKPEITKVKKIKEQPLGIKALDTFYRAYDEESSLGNLTADTMKAAGEGYDVGMANGGGLRANLNPGNLTYGDIFNVNPFDNQLAVVKMTGKQFRELVRIGATSKGGNFSWSENVKFTVDGCDLTDLYIDGEPVSLQKIYSVATTDFLAGGGGIKGAGVKPDQIEIFWERKDIVRDLMVEVLKRWQKDLLSTDYFSSSNRRQTIQGECKK